MANIPLCGGESIISDSICDEWIDITTQQIPKTFWKNFQRQDVTLNDERTWRTIAAFSNNCVKRRAYERKLRKDHNNNLSGAIPLPTEVPNDVTLSESEVEKLVDDSSQ